MTETQNLESASMAITYALVNGIPFERGEISSIMDSIPALFSLKAVEFMNACKENGVRIEKIITLFDGYKFVFCGTTGDAIIHSGSYGCWDGELESYGFSFDDGDVSVHTADELARLIAKEVGA